jgi:MFS family permease
MPENPSSEDGFSFRKIAVPAFGPSLLYGTSNGAILPVIALSAFDLGASQAEAGLIAALIGVGSLISNIPASLFAARVGERRAIMAAAGAGALALLLAMSASGLWTLALAMLINGAASAVFQLARQSFLAEAVPLPLRARAMSTLGGSNRIGVFIGPFLGAGLMHFIGLSGAYCVGIAAMAGAWLIASRSSLVMDRRAAPSSKPEQISWRTMLQVLIERRGVFLTAGLACMFLCVMRASRQVVIPLWAEGLGLSPALISIIFGLTAAMDMAVFYPAGRVMDIYGRLWVTLPSTLIMALCFMIIPATAETASFALTALALGFGNGISSGVIMTLAADAAPQGKRMPFLGVWRVLTDIGSCGGPVLLSLLTAAASLGVASFGIGLIGLIAAATFWRNLK